MDILYELVGSLKEEEQKAFKKFLTHKSQAINRKDVKVFETVCKDGKYESRDVVKKLYGKASDKNFRAHRYIRYSVKESLQDFIYQQVRKDDTPLYINKQIAIARFLYHRKKYSASWSFLKKAESIAIKAEEYELLNQVYQYMIEYAWAQPEHVLNEVIQKERENQTAAQQTRSLNLALSVIQNQIKTYHHKFDKPDIEKIVDENLEKFGVKRMVRQKASQYYKLAMLVKVSLEEKKDHKELYRYMINTLHEMEAAKLFNKYNYHYRIELLNVISCAAVWIGDYVTAEKHIKLIEEENKTHPETDLLSLRSYMAKVICLGYTDRLEEALEVLRYLELKYKKLYRYDDFFFITLNANIAAVLFHLGNIGPARKYLNELLNHQKRVLKYSGIQGLFLCNAIELLLIIEAEDMDFAVFRLKSVERKFKKFLQQPYNKRNSEFIKILRYIVQNQDCWGNKKFRSTVWEFLKMQAVYVPGAEFISFNVWLYSKLENVPYSEELYNKVIQKRLKSEFSMA